MKTVGQMLENIRKINADREAKQAVSRHAKDYTDLNIEQLAAGKTSEGDRIGKYRSRAYARMKNAMNPTPGLGNVDLILTGTFVNSFELDVNGDALVIEASDPNDLAGRYGQEIFGLDKQSKETFAGIAGQTMTDQIAAKL